jgi:hypothetical protein
MAGISLGFLGNSTALVTLIFIGVLIAQKLPKTY